MRFNRRSIVGIVSVVALCDFLTPQCFADPLYTVTNLGPATPSAAFLSGQNESDPSGNYLPLLNASQQAAFQAASFDVFAHPSTYTALGTTFFMGSGDIVNTDSEANPNYITPYLITSNNVGMSAGTGTEYSPGGAPPPSTQLVTFTSDPHTVTYQNPQTSGTTTVQSPGYLGIVITTSWINVGQTTAQVNGINDHDSIAYTQYTNRSNVLSDFEPHLYLASQNGARDVSLGSLGGVNGVASALNNSNQVVGWSDTASGAQHAFLYSNGTMQDLNLLIPPLSGITLVDAVGIDSAGDIVAYGTNAAGQMNEYYLTPAEVPAPEPGTLAIVGTMIAALALRFGYARLRDRSARD